MVSIIAEIGSNWLGDVEMGKRIIKECKNARVDGVKFQMWKVDRHFSSAHPFRNVLKAAELDFIRAKELKQFADWMKVDWFCSPYYVEAVDFLESLNVTRYQLDFKCLGDEDLMRKMASTAKPVYICINPQVDPAVLEKIGTVFAKETVRFLYCVPGKVEKDEDVKLGNMDPDTYDGFVDPLPTNLTSICAVARGAKIIEKNVCAVKNILSPDAESSVTVEELGNLMNILSRAERFI